MAWYFCYIAQSLVTVFSRCYIRVVVFNLPISLECDRKGDVHAEKKNKMKDQRAMMPVSTNNKISVSSEDVNHFMDEYKKRRKTQMARFFGVTVITLIACRMAMKKMTTTKGPLNTFQTNYAAPRVQAQASTGTQKGLASSLLVTTGMTLGIFGMGITGTCWSWDVSSFQELKQRLEKRANNELVITNMPLDKRSQQVVDALIETQNSSLCK